MAFNWQGAMQHPLTQLGAGMMAGFDPRGYGLGGFGRALLNTRASMQEQSRYEAEQARLAEQQSRAQRLADIQAQIYQTKLSDLEAQQRQRQQATEVFSDPTLSAQDRLMRLQAAYPSFAAEKAISSQYSTPSDFMTKLSLVGGDLERYRQVFGPAESSVSVTLPKEATEESKVVGKYYGEQFTQMMDAERQARTENAKLERLDQLFNDAYTGMGGEAVQSAKKALDLLGFDTTGVAEAEAGRALSSEMALQLRNPAGGAGMPGALSDRDREFLQSMVPGLATTPEGRKRMIDTKRRLNKRSMEVAKRARDYRRKHGRLDEMFYDELARFSEENPLFDPQEETQQGEMSAAEMAELQRLRQQQGF